MCDYENPWLFNGKVFTTEDIKGAEGFVYLITNINTCRRYIGRKYFWEIRRKRKSDKKRTRTESNWKEYYGSSPELTEDVLKEGKHNFKREILSVHKTRGDCNYEEVKQQFFHNVLETEGWYNGSIGNWKTKPTHIIEGRRYNEKWKNLGYYSSTSANTVY